MRLASVLCVLIGLAAQAQTTQDRIDFGKSLCVPVGNASGSEPILAFADGASGKKLVVARFLWTPALAASTHSAVGPSLKELGFTSLVLMQFQPIAGAHTAAYMSLQLYTYKNYRR